jgi:hypothetical protein
MLEIISKGAFTPKHNRPKLANWLICLAIDKRSKDRLQAEVTSMFEYFVLSISVVASHGRDFLSTFRVF